MKVYPISYLADPDVPFETYLDHIGDPLELTEERIRTFNKIDDALEFLTECSSPLTNISELRWDFVNKYKTFVPDLEEIKMFEETLQNCY